MDILERCFVVSAAAMLLSLIGFALINLHQRKFNLPRKTRLTGRGEAPNLSMFRGHTRDGYWPIALRTPCQI
jgi:hypothetical protein